MTGAADRSVGFGATLVTISQLITVVATGLVGIAIARGLGPVGTGAFNLVQTALAILVLFVSLGIENGVMYYVGGGRWPAAEALGQTRRAALVLGLAAVAIGAAFAVLTADTLFDGVDTSIVLLGIAATPFMLWWTYGGYLALATGDYAGYLHGPAAQGVISLLLVAPAAILADLPTALLALLVSHIAAGVLLSLRLRRRLPQPDRAGSRGRATERLERAARFGIPAQLTNALSMLSYRADLFVLNAVGTTALVGQYAIATSLTSLGWVAPRAVSAVILPRVASMAGAAEASAQEHLIAKAVRHAIILAIATTLALVVVVEAIPLVYGSAFDPAVELGLLLLPGVATLGVGNVLASAILGKGKPRCNLIVSAIVTPLTLGLYLVIVPLAGARGAAIASSVSYTASAMLFLHFFRRVTGIRDLRLLVPRRDDLQDYRRLLASARSRTASA